jgi:hypothetical protein
MLESLGQAKALPSWLAGTDCKGSNASIAYEDLDALNDHDVYCSRPYQGELGEIKGRRTYHAFAAA